MKLTIAVSTNKGTRSINEDFVSYRSENDGLVMVVADGLGGHDKGEVASECVGTYICDKFCCSGDLKKELKKATTGAQESLLELQHREKAENAMKTTVVALAIDGEQACFAHVGDSRGYVFEKGKKYTRTLDHSIPQMLALTGEIKEKEIRKHEERSSLLRVLGTVWEKDAVEISDVMDLKRTKAFLLCTDGFWELIDERNMRKCMKKSSTPQEWLERMMKVVEKNGAKKEMDNYTAGAVFVTEV